MADPCIPPPNKYPPKPCPCPEIPGPPGPPGPPGLQGPQGLSGNSFSARITPPATQGVPLSMPTNVLTAVPINGIGPFTFNWNTNSATISPQASTYIGSGSVIGQELIVTPGVGVDADKVVITSQSANAEGVIVCEVTDTGVVPNAIALVYHYIKLTLL